MKAFIVYCHLVTDFFNRVKQADFIVFDNTSRENELREKNWGANL